MNLQNDRVIGIVGGMGPEAGIALLNFITEHTPAKCDQDHFSVILMSFPKYIPDRTLFLENGLEVNPGFLIAQIIQKLERAGADVVGIACNTSHCPVIYSVIQSELLKHGSQVKLINMPLETCKHLKRHHPTVRRVGVMATNGTYRSHLYKDLLEQMGFEVILPDFKFQNDIIHRMIYDPEWGIKANSRKITPEVMSLTDTAVAFFRANGADAIIMGCTEFSMVFKEQTIGDIVIIDASEVLALALIEACSSFQKHPPLQSKVGEKF